MATKVYVAAQMEQHLDLSRSIWGMMLLCDSQKGIARLLRKPVLARLRSRRSACAATCGLCTTCLLIALAVDLAV